MLIPKSVVKRNKLLVTLLCCIPLWLIQVLRHETIGDDLVVYKEAFDGLRNSVSSPFDIDLFSHFEIGYQVFCNFVYLYVTQNFNIFLLIVSTLVTVPVSYFIYRKSSDVVLSFVIYSCLILYHFSFSGLRQSISISLTLLATYYLLENRKKIYFLLVSIASLFHLSAMICFFIYFLYKYRISNRRMNIALIGYLLILPLLRPIMLYLLTLLLGGEKYISSIMDDVDPSFTLMIVFILFYMISYKVDGESIFYRKLSLLAILGQSLGLISTHASRLGYFFIIYYLILLPEALNSYKFSYRTLRLIRFICFLFLVSFFFYSNADGYLEVIPYKFYWNG